MKKQQFVYEDKNDSKYEYVVTRRKKKGNPFLTALIVFLIIVFIGSKSSNTETPAATSTPTKTPFISATPKRTNKATAKPTSTPTTTPTTKPIPTPAYTPVPRLSDSQDLRFFMFSNDSVGATKHILVGGDYEPSGKYEVVCMEGHGVLTVNERGFCFAADEYMGKANGSKTYELSTIITLNANDKLSLRNYNSSKLTLYFYYIGE